jgi:glycosyltransferase involved in cell wall biosynthesis
MRIVDVSPMAVNPPRRGSAVRTHNLLRQLALRHDVRQFSLSWDDRPVLRPRVDEVHVAPTYTELRLRHPVADAANRVGMHAWVNAPVLSGAALELTRPASLDRLLRWADVVLVEFPWQFAYCRRRTAGPCVLASHNVEAMKFASWAVPAGATVTRTPWLRHIERVESRAARAADLVLAVSGDEGGEYVERYGVAPARVVEIRNGADIDRYVPADPAATRAAKLRLGLPERPTAVYTASAIPPNRAGADWVRRLAAAADGFTFLAVGEGARVRDGNTNVVSTGIVDDIRPYLDAADVAVCPIEHGAGTKIKLLEYMASGLPAVAFAPAVRGLDARDGVEVLVAEPTVASLKAAIDRLAAEPALAGRIGRAARELAVGRYDWASIAQRLDQALDLVCSPAVTRRAP